MLYIFILVYTNTTTLVGLINTFFISQQVEAYCDGWWYTAEISRIAAAHQTYTLRWTFARGMRSIAGYQAQYIRPLRQPNN